MVVSSNAGTSKSSKLLDYFGVESWSNHGDFGIVYGLRNPQMNVNDIPQLHKLLRFPSSSWNSFFESLALDAWTQEW